MLPWIRIRMIGIGNADTDLHPEAGTQVYKPSDRWTNRQTGIKTGIQVYRQAFRCTDGRQEEIQADIMAYINTDSQIGGPTGRQL